jgi:hypothetical protein
LYKIGHSLLQRGRKWIQGLWLAEINKGKETETEGHLAWGIANSSDGIV